MSSRRELHTWPQIARYVGLSVRAAQNYEKAAGLPVHRLAAQTRGRVLAYSDELDAWKSRAFADVSSGLIAVAPSACEAALADPRSRFRFRFRQWGYIGVVSALYAFLSAETVILEISYQFDRYRASALPAAAFIFCCMFVAFLSAMVVDRRRTMESKAGGLFLCITIVYGAVALVQLVLAGVLPTGPMTAQVGREGWSAQSAYLKNVVLYFLPMATFYILLPFHFVLAIQREVTAKRYEPILALLSGDRRTAIPAAIYPRVGWLAIALFVAALLSVVMTQDLFDHLKPNRYKNLFMQLALGRTLLLFGIALFSLLWYSKTLNHVKRRCIAGV